MKTGKLYPKRSFERFHRVKSRVAPRQKDLWFSSTAKGCKVDRCATSPDILKLSPSPIVPFSTDTELLPCTRGQDEVMVQLPMLLGGGESRSFPNQHLGY